MRCGFFITGTDTGIGKTFVTAGLLAALRRRGVDAVPMKPVQTGCEKRGGELLAPDLELCLATAGLTPSPEERALMAPYRFRPACSPHLAAERAHVRIDEGHIRRATRQLAVTHDCLLAEGAGGVLVPLDDRCTMLDMMRLFELPVLLVARPGLGTINHTLLSLRVLGDAGLTVAGIVINQAVPGPWGLIENDNVKTVERMGRVPVLACFRYRRGGLVVPAVRQAMDRLAARLMNGEEQRQC